MKKFIKFLFTLPALVGLIFAHIPQPKDSNELSKEQMKQISNIVGELHKDGASHDKLHAAVIKLFKQWGIEFKKLDIKKKISQK